MQRSKKILIGAGAVVLAAGWYAFRPERLWIDKVVSESFDTTAVALSGSADGAVATSTMPTMVSMGRFHGVAHDGRGLATIYRTADGKRTLRLTQFETSNGPELHLYLVAADDAKDDATVKRAGFVSLGPLKGNKGDQNYEIPEDVDLSKYRAVTVWCRRFGVNFTTAPLAAADMPAAAPTADPMVEGPAAIAAGAFHSNAHETKGRATIYRRADGTRLLRLTQFATSNGPDVRVYLVAAPDVKDDATVKSAGFIELGRLKGNKGDQNYEIPTSVDLAKYRSVTIWCARFSVNFGTAPLAPRIEG
ncbi:MAG: DM13 domain-containing protein [Gemmatimonadaceae bacterium]